MASLSSSEIVSLYKEGTPLKDLVRATGSYSTVYAALRKHNVQLRKGHAVKADWLWQLFLHLDDAIIQKDWGLVVQAKDNVEEKLMGGR